MAGSGVVAGGDPGRVWEPRQIHSSFQKRGSCLRVFVCDGRQGRERGGGEEENASVPGFSRVCIPASEPPACRVAFRLHSHRSASRALPHLRVDVASGSPSGPRFIPPRFSPLHVQRAGDVERLLTPRPPLLLLAGLIVYLGMMVGAFLWGGLADRLGRRQCLLISLSVNSVFAFFSSFVQGYGTFLFCRLLSGVG